MSTRSKPNKYTLIDEDTDEDIDNRNNNDDVSTVDTTDIQYTNNFIDEEAGIDLDDSEPISYEDTDDMDDMDGFIDDADVDDDDDATDDDDDATDDDDDF